MISLSPLPPTLPLSSAFLDNESGMINLAVEYMDGGSLQDIVERGGCSDEVVLADVAYQVPFPQP